ncbi:tRNA/rRNA cytosine-C5-methylase Nol1/Nop2/Sun [Acetobacter aceti NRIC 0242]|uniref:rRNA cytosine-C5-methylase n=1 Tax=Acetobacter aceti NBRC 14818 TaxID=887700 RepID=A0AB33IBV0_ACEAC|nr:RsmB/NOP family class I SAM-dependent RNA methyltransferase [Acetobacter aceti]TCS32862.1 16S rRNA (cytosine967-C5)-methyltransferase [Acetobacter aceti NBRC 14818]BCK74724.1 rRNA cytosine-C5-methylase [Acetobacter aceti NBRC 14818]GAN58359.1 tRNA/rRNA cytosine-C5-methylase [Acetobacter aceti NBRC 14818]GBO80965.1 tRNA/rRNA cytosine-C5-methylase Nol1/Nop2/Sun [Acetobacter aceti NRIC 0242]
MTPSARLAAAIDLLTAMDAAPRRPADATANSFFRERRFIGGGDRRAISAIVWDVLRQWRRAEWLIAQVGGEATPRLRVAVRQLLAGESFGDIAQSFVEGKFAPGALARDERRYLETLAANRLDEMSMPRAVRLEVPDWLLPHLEATFGETLETELAAMAGEATLDLRVNTLRGDREAAQKVLLRDGFRAELTELSPWGLRLSGRQPVTASTAFKEGLVEIQDEGSQLVVAMLGARPEMRILDYCAGAGGKTLAIAMMMQNRGHIVACDVSVPRLEGAVKRLRRAGIHNAERHLLVPGDKWAKRRAKSFDRVLVDAPCTGTGTWRRNPDARVRLEENDLKELTVKQAEILDRSAALVRPGGRLVYATCSILNAENSDQITAFLARHPDFVSVVPGAPEVPASLAGSSMLSLTPGRNGTDGFFAAVLERKE